MDPITIGLVGVAAATALTQLYISEKARGANEKRLKSIEKMFDGIVPPEYDIKVWDDPKLVEAIPLPKFDASAITPELYKEVGQYVPEVAEFVQEARPEIIKASGAAVEGRNAQMEALSRYKEIAAGGQDPELLQKLQQSADKTRAVAGSRVASSLQDANRRGSLNSGVEMAAELQGGASAMDRNAMESQGAAVESYKNQLMALDKSANLGGDIRASEMNEEGKNVGIINEFNQRTSKNYQDYLNAKSQLANNAQLTNLRSAQAISDANTGLGNKFAVDNRNRANEIEGQNYDYSRRRQQDAQAVQMKKEAIQQKIFDNQKDIANGKAGIASTAINMETQNAQDQGKIAQGLGNAAAGGLMYGDHSRRNPGPAKDDPTPDYDFGSGGQQYPSSQEDPEVLKRARDGKRSPLWNGWG